MTDDKDYFYSDDTRFKRIRIPPDPRKENIGAIIIASLFLTLCIFVIIMGILCL